MAATSPAPPIAAVIFDVDGTLLDSTGICPCMEAAFHEMYPRRHLPTQAFWDCLALTLEDGYRSLEIPEADWEAYHALVQQKIKAAKEPVFQVVKGLPGIAEGLLQSGLRLGLNTSRHTWLMEDVLKKEAALFRHFDPALMVTSDMVENPKPAPDSLLYLCQKSVLAPAQLLYIGDTPADMQCARAAGTAFCWAAWCNPAAHKTESGGYPVLRHPGEIAAAARQ